MSPPWNQKSGRVVGTYRSDDIKIIIVLFKASLKLLSLDCSMISRCWRMWTLFLIEMQQELFDV